MVGLILGVDFGTSNTVAVIGGVNTPLARVLFDGSIKLPSGVYAQDRDTLLTGRDAAQAAHTHPERYVAHPKSQMSKEFVELGPLQFSPVDLVQAVFERVWTEAARTAAVMAKPTEITETVIAFPDTWQAGRVELLKIAATRAGMANPRLIKEPIAAAAALDATPHLGLVDDRAMIVYDLGAGTFDASIVKRKKEGLVVIQSTGLPQAVGGLALDEAILHSLFTEVARHDENAVERVERPPNNADRREAQLFRDKIRDARESLSNQQAVQLYFPHYENVITLTRTRFEELAEPILQQTVDRVRDMVTDSGLAMSDVTRICLVGGVSRTPLVSTLLSREFNRKPMLLPDPEVAVAMGSIEVKPPAKKPVRANLPLRQPEQREEVRSDPFLPEPERRSRQWQRPGVFTVAAATVALGLVVAAVIWKPWDLPLVPSGGSPSAPGAGPVFSAVPGDGVLRIAGLLPQTGEVAEVGEGIYAAYDLAISNINDAGGVLGKPVEALRSDSTDDPQRAKEAVDALLGKNADVFIGPTASGMTLAVIDKIADAGRVEISPANTALRLSTYDDKGFYFRTAPPDKFQGAVLADLIIRDNKHTVGILVRGDDYGRGLAAAVQVTLSKQNIQVVNAQYDTADKDFSQEVGQLKAAKVDSVIIISFGETKQIVNELVKNGITTKNTNWYLVDSNFADYSADFPAGTMEGSKATQPGAEVSDDLKTRLLALRPNLKNFGFAPETYDAVIVSALAAEEAHSDNPAEIVKHIGSVTKEGQSCTTFIECRNLVRKGVDINYDGLSGRIEFDSVGDPTEATIGVYVYRADNRLYPDKFLTKVL